MDVNEVPDSGPARGRLTQPTTRTSDDVNRSRRGGWRGALRSVGPGTLLILANVLSYAWVMIHLLTVREQSVHGVGHLVDRQSAQEVLLLAVGCQLVANGLLLLIFPSTRRIGVSLLIGVLLATGVATWIALSIGSMTAS